uniref:Phospholipase A2 domain-containing protein n=1 Tax=Meloidogyne javanica TaxID=6303 RepID=A0A915LRL8_MELJA
MFKQNSKIFLIFIFPFIFWIKIKADLIPSADECQKQLNNGGTYDHYGCRCTGGINSQAVPVDEIDKCCADMEKCILPLYIKGTCDRISSADYYYFDNDTCSTFYERCSHPNECGIGLCKCFKSFVGCFIPLPIPKTRKPCTIELNSNKSTIRATKNSIRSAFSLFSDSITNFGKKDFTELMKEENSK